MTARSAAIKAPLPSDGFSTIDVGQLIALSLKGLPFMFDTKSGLFCHRLKRENSNMIQEGLSPRYSIMVCLGLERCKNAGLDVGMDTPAIVRGLLQNTNWIDDVGDLGLLLWLCAASAPGELASFCSRNGVKGALVRFPQAREGRTMQLAWFLTGLSYAASTSKKLAGELEGETAETYRLLIRNFGGHGAFGHLGHGSASFLRSHIGSFADQVYPIYALSKYGLAFRVTEARDQARRCAEMICRHQGSLGQWWWHYSSATGKIVERYPVYSVHQDGMAPMALFALGEATGKDFSGPIYKGLRWIAGANEFGFDFRDASLGVIWRSAYLKSRYQHRMGQALGVLGFQGTERAGGDLRVRFECRPYHLGWLLYAFAGRENRWTA